MRLCTILMTCLLFPELWPQESSTAPVPETPYVEREEKQFKFYPGGKIEITAGIPGDIRIMGWQKSTIRIEVEKIVFYHAAEEAKALLKEHPIKVRYNQTSATVRIPEPAQPGATMEFNFTLYVPSEKTDVKIGMSRGDFTIESVNGWVEVTDGEGSLEARGMAGYFSANTLKGDIYAEMSGKHWNGLEFAALTAHGSIDVWLPPEYSAALQLEARDGKITVDYPPPVVDGEPEPPDIIIRKNSQSLKGAVGDGGSPIKLVSYAGDIRVSRKE
jgi:DUF4097 and DUF4098 domain-containing protein YvlB